jgi:hypothetical protein
MALADRGGDDLARGGAQRYQAIVARAVREAGGSLVHHFGDIDLAHFAETAQAVTAAIRIQQDMDRLNLSGDYPTPELVRVGIHTGLCLVDGDEIHGDILSVAARFESLAPPGEIYLSETAYAAAAPSPDFVFRFIGERELNDEESLRIYKVFWDPREIEEKLAASRHEAGPSKTPHPMHGWVKLLLLAAIPLLILFALSQLKMIMNDSADSTPSRSIHHSIELLPAEESR